MRDEPINRRHLLSLCWPQVSDLHYGGGHARVAALVAVFSALEQHHADCAHVGAQLVMAGHPAAARTTTNSCRTRVCGVSLVAASHGCGRVLRASVGTFEDA